VSTIRCDCGYDIDYWKKDNCVYCKCLRLEAKNKVLMEGHLWIRDYECALTGLYRDKSKEAIKKCAEIENDNR
jgi:hypothetical protein